LLRRAVREKLQWFLTKEKLDALIVPTASRPPRLIKDDGVTLPPNLYAGTAILAKVTGWPDSIVSASFTSDPALPVGWSFIGPAFSEARLLALGYAFEQANPARTLPVTTPMPLASSSSSDRRYASPPRHFFGISFS
jgi:amidase